MIYIAPTFGENHDAFVAGLRWDCKADWKQRGLRIRLKRNIDTTLVLCKWECTGLIVCSMRWPIGFKGLGLGPQLHSFTEHSAQAIWFLKVMTSLLDCFLV